MAGLKSSDHTIALNLAGLWEQVVRDVLSRLCVYVWPSQKLLKHALGDMTHSKQL